MICTQCERREVEPEAKPRYRISIVNTEIVNVDVEFNKQGKLIVPCLSCQIFGLEAMVKSLQGQKGERILEDKNARKDQCVDHEGRPNKGNS